MSRYRTYGHHSLRREKLNYNREYSKSLNDLHNRRRNSSLGVARSHQVLNELVS